jgi:D-alanyl-D-alanine carboxypeptidase/D-alanyl-D-alanine-endopeptidase (penicillin-binding protein 4)
VPDTSAVASIISMRFLFLLFLALPCFAFSQTKIQPALEAFISDSELKNASVSITVTDVETGSSLASYNSERSLIPASSLKTITTATALSVLGADYRYKTELQYTGSIDGSGTLHGDLYIKGYGDPTLGTEWLDQADDMPTVLAKFTAAVQAAGIKKIAGHVIGDGSFFPTSPVASTWQWEDMGNYYGAGAFGLNLHENWYWLDFQQNTLLDSTPKVKAIRPEVPVIFIDNLVTSAPRGTGDQAYIYGAPFRHHVTVRGTIPVGTGTFTIKGSVPDAVLFAAHQVTERLKDAGIEITGLPRSIFTPTNEAERKVFYTHNSPELRDIVWEANHESVNLYCEVMLKTIGLKLKEDSDYDVATDAVKEYWEAKGLATDGMRLRDGSGLSSRTNVTSRQMASILRLIANDNTIFPVFYASLSTGAEGTLKGMFKGTKAFTNIRAKSGSMTGVRSYTGYATTTDGQLLTFSIIANNFTCKSSLMRKKMEKFMVSFCE